MAMLKGGALLFLKHGIKMGLYVRQAEAATSKWINELKNGKLKMMKLHGGNEVKTQYLRWMVAKSESPVENGGQHPTIFLRVPSGC